jgi:type VI secretion system secreted protein VgrG
MMCGYRFTLEDHPRADQNAEHLVVATRIDMAFGGYDSAADTTFCNCQFNAIEGSETFRPQRHTPKPVVTGLHTAIVVGPAGKELHTDEHGRVKIQFHWDRLGKKDEKSSCWVRVSSPWAGQSWGMISLPRIGQEVVVDFLEGDPDRPLITGRVYNGEQTPPYSLPANATVSTAKSRSSERGSASNFNELRFEDKKGEEYVWLQAEKDFHQRVKNDASLQVVGSQDTRIKKDLTEQVDGESKLKVGKDRAVVVTGSDGLKAGKDVIVDAGAALSQKSGANMDVKVGGNLSIDAVANVHIKGGANIVIEAGVMVTIKAGDPPLFWARPA